MVSSGRLRSSAVSCRLPRSPAVACGLLRSSVVSCGLRWSPVVACGLSCGLMLSPAVFCGLVRSPMVSCGLLRSRAVCSGSRYSRQRAGPIALVEQFVGGASASQRFPLVVPHLLHHPAEVAVQSEEDPGRQQVLRGVASRLRRRRTRHDRRKLPAARPAG